MKYKILIKNFISMVLIILISFFSIILTFILFYFMRFDKMILFTKKISKTLLKIFKKRRSISEIFYYNRKVNNFLGIKSCLKICISQKIIYAFFGYKAYIINGVKKSLNSPISGHAWIEINNNPIIHVDDDIQGYTKSFTI